MSDNIPPFDIQREIMKRVPDAKSLLRFRAVSKPWKAFIDSPEFIAGYGTRHTQPQSLLLRYKDINVDEVKYVSFLDDDDVTFPKQQQQLDFAPNVPDLVKHQSLQQLQLHECSEVIGSSCGLWCFYSYSRLTKERVVIWNPSIRKSVGIVVPRVLNKNIGKMTYYGFGVCPSTYDPTIVVISLCFQEESRQYKVGIFTFSSKTWKMIPSSNVPRDSIGVFTSTRVAIDRFIYWLAYDDIKNLILSFDLITHEFKEVNLPDSIANPAASYCCSISNLRESLVVFTTTKGNQRVYGVWMMGDEGGAMTSFTKLFTINKHDSAVRGVLGYTNSGEAIMEIKKDEEGLSKIKVHDPCSEQIYDDFGINGVDGSFFICPCTETLLLSDHLDGCIITNSY